VKEAGVFLASNPRKKGKKGSKEGGRILSSFKREKGEKGLGNRFSSHRGGEGNSMGRGGYLHADHSRPMERNVKPCVNCMWVEREKRGGGRDEKKAMPHSFHAGNGGGKATSGCLDLLK